jgi:hypothetical protein
MISGRVLEYGVNQLSKKTGIRSRHNRLPVRQRYLKALLSYTYHECPGYNATRCSKPYTGCTITEHIGNIIMCIILAIPLLYYGHFC